ncbi:zf-TFIIB domain-containing protein [bacterium]|nr:zf-TFIIB domain-containing protein [bacterium]
MNCPACKEPMLVLELQEIEIDHCIFCGGMWLDGGELELLLGTSTEKDKFLISFQVDKNTKEKARKCPICSKRMEKVLCGLDEKVCIDKCRKGDGLWFDKGELEEIIKIGSFDKGNRVLDLLKDMFGEKE